MSGSYSLNMQETSSVLLAITAIFFACHSESKTPAQHLYKLVTAESVLMCHWKIMLINVLSLYCPVTWYCMFPDMPGSCQSASLLPLCT